MTWGVAMALTTCIVVLTGACAVIDARTLRIPNALVLGILACVVAYRLIFGGLGVALAVAAVVVVALLGLRSALGTGSLGAGDVKLMGALAVFLGLEGVLALLLASCVFAAAYGVCRRLWRKVGSHGGFAFAPFVFLGLLTCMFL